MTSLPHDSYIEAVTTELATYGITVTKADTTTQDGELLEAFIEFDQTDINTDTWQDGVYLGWDQRRGWHLIEAGGGRNVTELDPEGVNVFSSPQQVAWSAGRALNGRLVSGPIRNDGSWVWDSRPLEAAIAAWEADEA
ncbi:DUF6292 family protein [Streptomyces acidicola]|uniref:DUF6292 domain-containing protein n=1 Tax=Streptomyces acidicola TaxID=2596892 RepID=A0A5N8WJE6_9ACTN|nr:DUF6292 family protein [Streptomyces acidicola]MPY47093.1 hypothetical protein [Streptomyces acidicola]MPY47232.1 hypothetical protein [Streptomyces acidicola]